MKKMLKLTELNKREMSRVMGGRPAHCGCACGNCTCQGEQSYDTVQADLATDLYNSVVAPTGMQK